MSLHYRKKMEIYVNKCKPIPVIFPKSEDGERLPPQWLILLTVLSNSPDISDNEKFRVSGNILNFLQEFISPNRPQTNRESNFLQLLNSLFFTCNEESSIKFFELVIDNPFLVTTNQNRKEVIELLIIHGKANCPPIDDLYTFLSSLRNDEVLSIFNELMENL